MYIYTYGARQFWCVFEKREWDLSIKVHILDCDVSTIISIISLLLSAISAVVTDAYKRKVLF